MAKSARASSKKVNHKKLRARVFAPVEKARAERLHAKLLETIQQPKPEQAKMDTTEDCELLHYVCHSTSANTLKASATEATKEDDLSKGSSFLTASIPRSLSDPTNTKLDSVQDNCDMRNLCFYLGLCSDIVGFSEGGDLTFAFDPLPPHWLSENPGLIVT
jgi:hypothetical protein